MCCIANQEFTKADVIGYHYSMLAYQFMMNAQNAREVFGEGVMAGTRDELYTLAIRLAKAVSSPEEKLYTVWLVSARFVCL